MKMFDPPHPGELLREVMGNQITISALAAHLGVTRANLSMILNGRAGVSAAMSLKLDEALGLSEGLWARAQMEYDLARARKVKRRKVPRLAEAKFIASKPKSRSRTVSASSV